MNKKTIFLSLCITLLVIQLAECPFQQFIIGDFGLDARGQSGRVGDRGGLLLPGSLHDQRTLLG